ncbi:hypothetical protein DEO72_LG2g2690 [Vigna unguiculata]|uniref:Uncharacterized protein n=1 Tax=Vigna unguiculata TaxID=3917 RepID=A0A4D6L1K5_VIGUN|nr:hypothetical protein DEO72_LG2g2690 [Vigna unguiculata]
MATTHLLVLQRTSSRSSLTSPSHIANQSRPPLRNAATIDACNINNPYHHHDNESKQRTTSPRATMSRHRHSLDSRCTSKNNTTSMAATLSLFSATRTRADLLTNTIFITVSLTSPKKKTEVQPWQPRASVGSRGAVVITSSICKNPNFGERKCIATCQFLNGQSNGEMFKDWSNEERFNCKY